MVLAAPKISIRAELNAQKSPAFLGRITVDELRPGKFEGTPYQWVIAVKPFKFPVKGQGFPNYIGIKDKALQGEISENSQLGMHLKAFRQVFPDLDFNIGEGDLLDQVAFFERYEHEYPPNRDGAVYKTQMLIPVRAATAEELAEVGIEAPTDPADIAYSDEEVAALLKALSGKRKPSFQKAVFAARLAPSLIQGVVSGVAIDYLVDHGYATLEEGGELVATA